MLLIINPGEDFVHNPSGEHDFPIGNVRRAGSFNAAIKLRDQLLHAEVLIKLAPKKIADIGRSIAKVLSPVSQRREEEGEIALGWSIPLPNQRAANMIDENRVGVTVDSQLIDDRLDLTRETEEAGSSLPVPEEDS